MFMPNCIHTKRLGVILGVAISTIIVGCSSVGEGRNVAAAASRICGFSSGDNPFCQYYNNSIRTNISDASENRPTALFQASENTDSVTAEVTSSRTGLLFDVVIDPRVGSDVTISNRGQAHSEIGSSVIVSASTVTVTVQNVLLYSDTTPQNVTAYVDMIHDYNVTIDATSTATPPTDSDYMAAGVWALRKGANNYEIGAFADGSQPFTQDIASLSNTATYIGEAIGLWSSASSRTEGTSVLFDGRVSLTADFDSNSISGVIDDISGIPEYSPTITLGDASIATSGSGFYSGPTETVVSQTVTLSGFWGGQFFGNEEPSGATDFPKSTAGTFGGSAGLTDIASDAITFIGAFLGYK